MTRTTRDHPPKPPKLAQLPLVNAGEEVARWLEHYWHKLRLPASEARRLAVTDDRREFYRWTGRRLQPLALGCYCYLPNAGSSDGISLSGSEAERATLTAPAAVPTRLQPALPGFAQLTGDAGLDANSLLAPPTSDYRHLIFVEPDLLPLGIEVTVAHELIHLADRVANNPRKHHCHGYDAISVDEALVTGRDPELLRAQLRDETTRREEALRRLRPYRYLYVCPSPSCGKEYPRVVKYKNLVSCGRCDKRFNAAFILELRALLPAGYRPPAGDDSGGPPSKQ
jgi:hypothetical protein